MKSIFPVPDSKIFAGILFKEESVRNDAFTLLEKKVGKIISSTVPEPFTWTSYYKKEMGAPLLRQFVLFSKIFLVSRLPSIKLSTNAVEALFFHPGSQNRQINIDPGYLTLDKAVLATTKNFSHRVHLESGIFSELTYRNIGNTFTCLDWTYPEYRESGTVKLFNGWRDILKKELAVR
ncbi:MAG: DUF4416 family protein [Nitrospinota bacterium]